MTIFKDGPDLHGKKLAADIALIGSNPGAFAVHFADSLFAPAVGTNGTIGSPLFEELRVGFGRVGRKILEKYC